MNEILKAWEKIKQLTRRAVGAKISLDLSGRDEIHIKKMIADCIFARGGEISSRSRAVELGKIYINLSKTGRERFMRTLAREFDINFDNVNEIIPRLQEPGDEDARINAEMELAKAMVPPRVKLLKQFTSLPNGFKFLIDFRAELLQIKNNDPYLRKLDADLKNILSSWFDIELLDLKEITWQSPASLLEKLIKYEAVHEIRSWADLKNRLDSDRLCYAFFHNKMPHEPLIFVEVALVNEIATSIQELLDEEATTTKPEEVDTAVFYSISNAQNGLAGINLGNFLIKRVVNELSNKLKGIKNFVTLSPVPGFRKWLDPVLNNGEESILTGPEIKAVKSVNDHKNAGKGLLELLNSDWSTNPEAAKTLQSILMRLCAGYLLQEKRSSKKALDPVANFHLENGALIGRINWLGDTSANGLKLSAGIMVNYYYKLSDIEKNHELYITESRIQASKDVKKWLKKS